MTKLITVEVAYALPQQQTLLTVQVLPHTSAKTIIERSGILDQHPEIDLKKNPIGIFSKKISLDYECRDKDRIEIYRPLLLDPKEARRKKI